MFGLPGQSLDDWVRSLRWAIRLNPEHLSAYGLILEEGTRLHHEHRAGSLELPDEETEAAMYQMTIELLQGAGFEQYEISNFSRPGFHCRHNLVYWQHQEYLGLGAGAYSFLGGRRFYNELLPANYLRAVREREALEKHRDAWEAARRQERDRHAENVLDEIATRQK